MHSVQAVPPPPQPEAVAKALADAENLLYNHDADGNITGPSIKFQNWIKFSQAYADAKAGFALAQAQAMADPVLGSVWPATGSSLQQKVDTAYQISAQLGRRRRREGARPDELRGRVRGRALRLPGP